MKMKDLQSLPKKRRSKLMALIVPKTQRINDDSSLRVFVVIRLDSTDNADEKDLASSIRGKHQEVFMIVFDLSKDEIVHQVQLKNDLDSSITMTRYNLLLYCSLEQSSEMIVT
jgi:hypothetical protein